MRINKLKDLFVSLVALTALSIHTPSKAYEIYDAGAFLNSPSLSALSLGYLDGVYNDFAGSGVDLSFVNSLDSNGLGQLTWEFTNNTATTLFGVNLFGYLDGEIDSDLNSSFNEYGQFVSVSGVGSADTDPDSWEIDEPGFVFGDIYDNLFLGQLDNSNGVPLGAEDDVSLALGFELGDILAGDTWLLALTISEENIGGLFHGDDHSGTGIYMNGSVTIDRATPVDEPAPFYLFLMGLTGLFLAHRTRPGH